jgi:hypothetical protein
MFLPLILAINMSCEDNCMILLGRNSECKDAKIVEELITKVNKHGKLLSLQYKFSDGTFCDFSGFVTDSQKINYMLHHVIAKQLKEMFENNLTPRVMLTCNDERDISIPYYLMKIGSKLVTTHYSKK